MNFGLKALACLLLYPDAALKDNLPEIKEGVGGSSKKIMSRHLISGRRRALIFLSICTEIRVREVLRCSILKSSTKNEA